MFRKKSLDLCVSKLFASALFAFGIEDKAHKINEGKRQQKCMRMDFLYSPLGENWSVLGSGCVAWSVLRSDCVAWTVFVGSSCMSLLSFLPSCSFLSLSSSFSFSLWQPVQVPAEQTSDVKWANVPTQNIKADGVDFAYRELGQNNGGTPVVFLTHLAAVLDNWDPRIVDGIAAKHHIVAFDNRGIGTLQHGTIATDVEVDPVDSKPAGEGTYRCPIGCQDGLAVPRPGRHWQRLGCWNVRRIRLRI